ncbi:hypothetical protein [Paenibacillus sp. FSL E2-0177]|uniref:hypothetical protein n=1 Tax=Paenibacillus sp. FSL E2-0177 TaxID=2921360 RepID=UPI0030EE0874
MASGVCALCKQESELMESHIIPKFIGKWLKETSATGYLRSAVNVNRRTQDLKKTPLLCNSCEQIFSANEKLFAENIFKPFQDGQTKFDYDEWLIKFITSLSWRVGTMERLDPKNDMSDSLRHELNIALDTWGEYLLGRSSEFGNYKHHMFFLDRLESVPAGEPIPDHTNAYFLRTVDATVANNENTVFVYSKMPGIFFVSHVLPNNMTGWKSTRIHRGGRVKIPQSCAALGVGDFLKHRVEFVNGFVSNMSDDQRKKIVDAVSKDPDRFERSRSIDVLKADQILRDHNKNNKDY